MKCILGNKSTLTLRALTIGAALLLGALAAGCTTDGRGLSTQSAETQRNRQKIAEAMFRERCKTAGENIYRTVDNVEGIFLMKVRPEKIVFSDQFAMDDPYGDDAGGNGYIENFLRPRALSGSLVIEGGALNGYRYVDAIDEESSTRYRYAGKVEEPWQENKSYLKGYVRFVLTRKPTTAPVPRYALTYEDISSTEEREYWIAGSSLKVIDLITNEVIAERIGYMMDEGYGNTSGGRSPWLMAAYHACPSFPTGDGMHPVQIHQSRNFVEKVLHIKQGN